MASRDWDAAAAALSHALEVRPLDGETWLFAAQLELGRGSGCGPALDAFDRALSLGATPSETSLVAEAVCCLEHRRLERAREIVRLLRVTNPEHPKLGDLERGLRER